MTKKRYVAVGEDLVADTKHERLMNNVVVADMLNCFIKENKQLKHQIKDLRLGVVDSIHKAEEIQCSCNPCVVEECVKRVIE